MGRIRKQESRGEDYVKFGQKIKSLRESEGMTQEELAQSMEISKTSINNYENGTRKVPLSIILQFSSFFNVSIDELLDINIDTDDSNNESNDNDLYVEFGKKLRYLRTSHGYTQIELAKAVDLSQTAIAQYEAGSRKIPLKTLKIFSEFYDLSLDELIEPSDDVSDCDSKHKPRTQQTRGKVYEDFGENIRRLRMERNLTQDDLSKLIGISRTNIGQYETGVRKAPLSVIVQLSSFFGVSVDKLLDINISSNDSDNKNAVSYNKAQHLTKYEVATEMGFTKDEIDVLDSSTKKIPRSFFEKFANYFGVDLNNLTALDLEADRPHAVITTEPILKERYEKWQQTIGYNHFTDEEIEQLMDYAQYLISKRNR